MNLMIDLETLSTRSNAVIVSLGAVLFTPDKIVSSHYAVLDLEDQLENGRHVEAGTLKFWFSQKPEAQAVFKEVQSEVRGSLLLFSEWIKAELDKAKFDGNNLTVWSNGAAFDIPMIEDLFKDYKIKLPWKFRNARCFRTYDALTKCKSLMTEADTGVAHNALSDATWQATAMIKYRQVVKK
jgi:DNA polymerase III epsilon subunit-like protein